MSKPGALAQNTLIKQARVHTYYELCVIHTEPERPSQLSETLEAVKALVAARQVRISEHGYDEIAEDGIYVRDVLAGVDKATVAEDYPTFPKGRAVLVLQFDKDSRPIHVVWGIPKGFTSPAVVVTAYRPDPERWDRTFTKRRGKDE